MIPKCKKIKELESDTGWQELNLINNVVEAETWKPCVIRRKGNIVNIRGIVKNLSSNFMNIAQITDDLKPSQDVSAVQCAINSTTKIINIYISHYTGVMAIASSSEVSADDEFMIDVSYMI